MERAVVIEEALREALRDESFTLVYQPIYDAAGSVRRVEALLRRDRVSGSPCLVLRRICRLRRLVDWFFRLADGCCARHAGRSLSGIAKVLPSARLR